MQLALGTTIRRGAFTPRSRQAALAAPLMVGVPYTHELLVHTHGSKQRKRRAGKSHKASPNHHGLTALASSVSNLDFLRFYGPQSHGSGGGLDSQGVGKIGDESQKGRARHSDEIIYASPSRKVVPSGASGPHRPLLQRKSSSSAPRLDKVTQTNGDSPSKQSGSAVRGVHGDGCSRNSTCGVEVANDINGRCSSSCRDLSRGREFGGEIAGSSSHTCLFRTPQTCKNQGSVNSSGCANFLSVFPQEHSLSSQCLSPSDANIHPLLSSKQSRLFSVRQLRVESTSTTDDEEDDIGMFDSSTEDSSNDGDNSDSGRSNVIMHKRHSKSLVKEPGIGSHFGKKLSLPTGSSIGQDKLYNYGKAKIKYNDRPNTVRKMQTPKKNPKEHIRPAAMRDGSNSSGLSVHSRHGEGNISILESAQNDPDPGKARMCTASENAVHLPNPLLSQPPSGDSLSQPMGQKTTDGAQQIDCDIRSTLNAGFFNGDIAADTDAENTESHNEMKHRKLRSSRYHSNLSGKANNSNGLPDCTGDLAKENLSQSASSGRAYSSPFSPLSNLKTKPSSPIALPPPPSPSRPPRTLPQSPQPSLSRKELQPLLQNTPPLKTVSNDYNSKSKITHLPLLDFPQKSHQVFPTVARPKNVRIFNRSSDIDPRAQENEKKPLVSWKNQEPLISWKSEDEPPHEDTNHICDLPSASSDGAEAAPRSEVTKQNVGAERRKRIHKLQQDLVRISKELQDLDNLEYDVSEV